MITIPTGSSFKRKALGLAFVAAMAAQSPTATAASISYSGSLSGGAISLALFDASLGTLESIQLDLSFSAFGFLATSVPISTFTVDVRFSSPLLGASPFLTATKSSDVNCNPTCAATLFLSGSESFDYADASLLQAFTDLGNFTIFGVADSNFPSPSTSIDFSANAKITYNYAEADTQTVPLPSSLALVGLALLGAAAMRAAPSNRLTAKG